MHQLSVLDATFLYLETPEMPMHVGALHVLELPAGFRGRFVTALRAHLKTRLPLAPVLRRRLWWMPLNLANPAWVDAEPDLREHVVEIKLPRGAGQAQLEAEVGRLHPVLLDRKRPLWKMHVFEGLAPSPEGRRRVGLYTQLHHAAVDGQAAVALANLLLDVTPEPRRIPLKTSKRQKTFELGMVEMLRGALGAQAMKVAQIVRELPSTVGTLKNAAVGVATRSALFGGKGGPSNLALAPRTPLNVSVTPQRAFAALSLPMADVRALAHALDATVNDLVLMLCSSALRRYYARRKALPRKSLIAAVPISLRQAGDDAPDNQASMSLVSLGTHIADPMKRLQHIVAATKAMKATMGSLKSVLPTDYPSLGIPWLIEAATALYGKAKVADRIPQVANVVISNVPGPSQPLYLAGALMPTLAEDFFTNPTGSLGTVKCLPWNVDGKALLIGDSAHAMVPFYGQGMNCAFEDCRVFDELIEKHQTDWEKIFEEYTSLRKPNADAICDLAEENFYEMRDAVADPVFQRKRELETRLEQSFPDYFSKYSMVTFREDLPYSLAQEKGNAQDKLLMRICSEIEDTQGIDLDEVMKQIRTLL